MSSAVRQMLEPRSIAVVGASERPGSFGERMATEVLASTAPLDLHFVNPGYDTILDRPCIASLDDISGPVDLVLLGVGDASIEAELTRAAKRGDRSAVIYGNAYEPPMGGVEPLRSRLARIARDADMALCGAGCMGFVNVARGVRAIGYVEPDPLPTGGVALVTHSGSLFSALLRARRGFGFSLAVSSGQELVTTAGDYLQFAVESAQTSVVALVLETVRDPARFRHALSAAAARDLPVVLLPVGSSEAGASMVAAHSGAVAGGTASWEALADAYGVHLVADPGELLDTVEVFAAGRRPRAVQGAGTGLAAVLDSGAERALLVDVAAAVDVPFAVPSPATLDALAARLDPGLIATNPLDVWGTGADTEGIFGDVLVSLAADPAVRAVALAVDLVVEYDHDESYRDAVLRAAAATDLPLVVLSHVPSAIDPSAAARLRAAGVPVLEGTRSGLVALRHLLAHADREPPGAAAAIDAERQTRWMTRLAAGPLTAEEGLGLLADYGIASADARAGDHEGAVLAAAEAIGYPVVLKTDEGVAHKTDVGGVVVGLGDPDSLVVAYREMAERLGSRVVVCQQVTAGVEVLLGAVRDPSLGMLVVVGVGGVLVEQIADRVAALPGFDARHGRRLIARTRLERVLLEPRSGAPADVAALVESVAAFSTLVTELGDALEALDLNPVICTPTGAVAVDVHLERRDAVLPQP